MIVAPPFPDFHPVIPDFYPVIPAKAGIQRFAGDIEMSASVICQHALGRADIRLKRAVITPSFLSFLSVIAPLR